MSGSIETPEGDDPRGANNRLPFTSHARYRSLAGAIVVLASVAAAYFAIFSQRHSFATSLERIGAWPIVAGLFCGLLGVGATYPLWREVLTGLGVRMPWAAGARVFFTSQLGKYVPGSVWPAVMQMEAGRARGASRRTMLAANLVSIVLNCCVGLAVACLLLPFYDATALARYWWALLFLPLLLVLVHPRTLPGMLDWLLSLLHRPPMRARLLVTAEVRASGWALLSWISLGAQIGVLSIGVGARGFSAMLLSVGGMALAMSLGVLFVPAPAGAGIRDVVLALVLHSIMTTGQALAVVVASRALLVACDVLLAGLAALGPTIQRADRST